MGIRRVKGKIDTPRVGGDIVDRLRHVAGCYDDLDEKALLFEGLAEVISELRALAPVGWEGATRDIALARSEASEVV